MTPRAWVSATHVRPEGLPSSGVAQSQLLKELGGIICNISFYEFIIFEISYYFKAEMMFVSSL